MSNSVQEINNTEQVKSADTPMESPVSTEKGKGKMAAADAMDEDESSSDEEQVSESRKPH